MLNFLRTLLFYLISASLANAAETVAGRVSQVSRSGNIITITAHNQAAHIYAQEPGDLGLPLKVSDAASGKALTVQAPPPASLTQDGDRFFAYTGSVSIVLPEHTGKVRINYGVCDKQCIEEKVDI